MVPGCSFTEQFTGSRLYCVQVLLDELVLPDMPIVNYNTAFSGDQSDPFMRLQFAADQQVCSQSVSVHAAQHAVEVDSFLNSVKFASLRPVYCGHLNATPSRCQAAQAVINQPFPAGISPAMMKGVTTTLAQIQQRILHFVGPDTFLVGHSLENDLRVMRLVHLKNLDTAIMYPNARVGPDNPQSPHASSQPHTELAAQLACCE